MQVSEIVSILRSVTIFAQTPEPVLFELASEMKECRFSAGETVIRKGELGTAMFIIASGLTKVHDDIHTLVELGAGNFFGEISIIDTEPRSASVTTLEPTVLFCLEQDDFYNIIGNRPEVLRGIIRILMQRMRGQNDLMVKSLKQRQQELSLLVEERTAELREANRQMMEINDEIRLRNNQLEDANTAIRLKQSELENAYKEINNTLEKVNLQNTEITRQKTLLEEHAAQLAQSLDTIRHQQDIIVQSERMAAIGMLAPIVAHEINTPLGVLYAALQNISSLVPQAFQNLTDFADRITTENKTAFNLCVERALQEAPTLSTREERRYIRETEDLLSSLPYNDTEEIAEKLVKIGFIDETETVVSLLASLPPGTGSGIIDILYTVGIVRKQMGTMKTAIERAQKIVTTLNNYVYKRSDSDDPVETDVAETVTTVLTLYEYHIAQGIEVVSEIEENLPPVLGFPDQLSQVWTNLLLNARHAVKNQSERQGKITVLIREVIENEKEFIAVSVTDNGTGIPEEVKDKIFQPLFTTKAKGEGTGQGLSISKGIIENHGGTVTFESEPGETTFTVRLPVPRE